MIFHLLAQAAAPVTPDASETIAEQTMTETPPADVLNESVSTILEPFVSAWTNGVTWLLDNRVALIYLIIGIVVSFLFGYFISWLLRSIFGLIFRRSAGGVSGRAYVRRLHLPIMTTAVMTGIVVNLSFFGMSGEFKIIVLRTYYALISLIVVWMIMAAIAAVDKHYKDKLVLAGLAQDVSLDGLMIDLLRRVAKVTVWIIAVIFICRNIFKFDVSAMIAGAGVAGLAIAFAAQNTVANLFGAISLVLDKPFAIGDFIKFSDKAGTVESIGLRSTRLRGLDGVEWNIPNKELSEASLQNITRRKYMRHVFQVGLVYETTADQIRLAESILHEILDTNPLFDMQNQPPRIFFNDMKDWALQIEAYVWFPGLNNWAAFQAEVEKINFEILDRFNKVGLSFAFPSNTTYLVQESKASAEAESAR